jgi:hypothetical protein
VSITGKKITPGRGAEGGDMAYEIHYFKFWPGPIPKQELWYYYACVMWDIRQHTSFSRPVYVDDPNEGVEEI